MNLSKELLILKTNIRNEFPKNKPEISKLFIKIFTLKFQMTESDFKAKCNSLLSDNVSLEEYPLCDKHLLLILHKSSVNAKSIYKILVEISDDNATINYAPLLFPLISFMLFYLNETETKNCIEKLLTTSEMMPGSKSDWNIFCHLLFYLGKQFATKAFKHIDKTISIDNTPLFYWPCAVWNLPIDHLTRIIPCYFIEGIKIFYRAGLLVWKECFNRHKNELNSSNFKELLIKTAKTIDKTYTDQQFINRMFRIRNFSRKSITVSTSRLSKQLPFGDWISPTSSKGYVAFKMSHENPSKIVTSEELIEIIRHLDPILSQISKPIPVFSTNQHGYSLISLYNRAEEYRETLLLMETAKAEVIGAFCTDTWTLKNRVEPNRFFGRGGCFVFRIRPKPTEFHRWNGATKTPELSAVSDRFQRATADSMEIGGGAITVDKSISKGSSVASMTFNSPCLTPFSNRDFMIRSLELLAFTEITEA